MSVRPSGRHFLTILSVVLIGGGALVAYVGNHHLRWGAPPAPPAWTARVGSQGVPITTARPLSRSEPVFISIPRLRVWARVIPRGLNPDGTVAVPSLSTPFLTSWFDQGPAPGQPGTAALYGHVDARSVGPAVFYDLGLLRQGNLVYISLRDRQIAVFKVYAIALYPKASFPTTLVYGYTRSPTLRLITCGGTFDPSTHHYLGNIVVFASYIGAHG
jgi:hypothetical protein